MLGDDFDAAGTQLDVLGRQMTELTSLSQALSQSIGKAFGEGVAHGRSFEAVLKDIGTRLQDLVLKASMKPLEGLLSSGLEALHSSFNAGLNTAGSSLMNSIGGTGGVMPFAQGGVVSAPTFFPWRGGLGVAGEAGAEAILPLARGPDGRLGVRAQAGGGRASVVNVTISTPDAESFRRSEAQVSAALARAVARGQRAL